MGERNWGEVCREGMGGVGRGGRLLAGLLR